MSDDLQKIHDIALSNVLEPNPAYYYRLICRKYSEKFHTPLHVVFTLPKMIVLINYFEPIFEMMDDDDVEEVLARAANPDWSDEEEQSIQDFVALIEDEIKTGKKPKKKPDLKSQLKKLKEAKQSLRKGSPHPSSGRRVFSEESVEGEGSSGLELLDELQTPPEGDQGGSKLPG